MEYKSVWCEVITGYNGNMEIYTAVNKKMEETIFSVLETYLDQVYQENYYNNVEIAENLLLRKTGICETVRANRGIL
jgi:hypothetical protein